MLATWWANLFVMLLVTTKGGEEVRMEAFCRERKMRGECEGDSGRGGGKWGECFSLVVIYFWGRGGAEIIRNRFSFATSLGICCVCIAEKKPRAQKGVCKRTDDARDIKALLGEDAGIELGELEAEKGVLLRGRKIDVVLGVEREIGYRVRDELAPGPGQFTGFVAVHFSGWRGSCMGIWWGDEFIGALRSGWIVRRDDL